VMPDEVRRLIPALDDRFLRMLGQADARVRAGEIDRRPRARSAEIRRARLVDELEVQRPRR
jgi:hypothetical protein